MKFNNVGQASSLSIHKKQGVDGQAGPGYNAREVSYIIKKTAGLFFSMICFSAIAEKQPNVVFIYADDWGWGDLSCHGHSTIKTPNIDRLAKEGMDFHNFTVNNPVCSPSRVGLISGTFPSRLGVHQHFSRPEANANRNMPDWLDPDVLTVPDVMKSAGYATAHYGKWHLSTHAFDEKGTIPEYPAYGYDDAAVYAWNGPNTRHVLDGTSVEQFKGTGAPHKGGCPEYVTIGAVENALKFIEKNKERPFFINLWIHETHTTIAARPEDRIPYLNVPEPEQTYYSAVTRADTQIGRVLDRLDELNLADSTIVVFSSDNGPERSNPNPDVMSYYSQGTTGGMRGQKRSLYSGGVCVPFIVRWPGRIPAGKVDETTMLSAVDMLPTLAAAVGSKLPAEFAGDGQNMLPALLGTPMPRTKPLFWKWAGGHSGDDWPAYSMRDGNWVYLMSEDGSQAELYDIKDDRSQSDNQIESQPERAGSMRNALEAWIDTLPKTVPARLTVGGTSVKAPSPVPSAKKHAPPAAKERPNRSREEVFVRVDANSDGTITFEEYLPVGPSRNDPVKSRERFDGFDDNGDGILSRDEFVNPRRQ